MQELAVALARVRNSWIQTWDGAKTTLVALLDDLCQNLEIQYKGLSPIEKREQKVLRNKKRGRNEKRKKINI